MQPFEVEFFEPSHGSVGKWYTSDTFPTLALANARKREVIRTMKEYGIAEPIVRVTRHPKR